MAEQRTIAFSKMSGLGNDFIIIDARENALALTPEQVRQLATRDNEITKGYDQLLVLHPPKSGGDIFMQIFNADGGEVEACGNGARAVVHWLMEKEENDILPTIETTGGILHCWLRGGSTRNTRRAAIKMPPPKFGWRDIPLSEEVENTHEVKFDGLTYWGFLVNVGNPHAVFFVADSENVDDMARIHGAYLVQHPLFAQGANISFACIRKDRAREIDIATWERGAGLTQSCGTGACAVAIAAIHLNLLPRKGTTVDTYPPFGRQNRLAPSFRDCIRIDYEPENGTLLQYGPATLEFDGEITL